MSIAALSAGLSGLNASQRALDASAHNVANASTQGFKPQQVQFQEASPAGSGVTLSQQARAQAAATPAATSGALQGPSGTDLGKQLTDSLVYKAQFDLSAKVIKSTDQTLGSLINIKA
jgi:flagellar hook protein FlgE